MASLTVNTGVFHYKDQQFNTVYNNKCCLFWQSYATQKYTVWEERRIF